MGLGYATVTKILEVKRDPVAQHHNSLFLSHTTCPLWAMGHLGTPLCSGPRPKAAIIWSAAMHVTKEKKALERFTLAITCCNPEVRGVNSIQSLAKTSHVAHSTSRRLGNAILAYNRRGVNQK